MRRLLLLLMAIILGVTHAAAAPYALCRHVDAETHLVALDSSDPTVANEAHREEAAKAAMKKVGSLSDNVSAALANGILPEQASLPRTFDQERASWLDAQAESLRDRAIAPLLQPPLA